MSKVGKLVSGLLVVLALWISQPVRAQEYTCDPASPPGYKKLVIDAASMTSYGTLQYSNDDRVWIVVENINPFVATYTLKVKREPVAETAVLAFLTDLGGIDAGLVPAQKSSTQTPKAVASTSPTPTPANKNLTQAGVCDSTPLNQLIAKYTALTLEEQDVNRAINAIATKYKTDGTTYANLLSVVQQEQRCKGIQKSAIPLRQFLAGVQSPDQLKPAVIGGIPDDNDPTQALKNAVTQLVTHAKDQRKAILDYKRSAVLNSDCLSLLDANKQNLDDEDRFIDGLIGPTSGTSETQALTDQLNKLNTIYGQWNSAHTAIEKLFDPGSSGNPFVLTKALTDNQSDEEITLDAGPAAISRPSSAAASRPAKTTSVPAPNTATAPPASFDTTIHFGYGARFTIGGGLVVSFLQNRQFTTANGQIAYQNHSQTRILPIAMLNSRFYDCDPDSHGCLWIPQLSVGITAKADDKGTAPEYLIGPSWGFLRRQLFLTVGAYAGQQQRLLGGLQVGQTTSLSAANLPIAKEYHWSAAIAITWKVK